MNFQQWILTHGDSLQFLLFGGVFVLAAIAERLIPRRTGPMQRPLRWRTNLFLTAISVVTIGALPFSFISAAMWAESRGWGLLNQRRFPVALVVLLTLLVRGFISFFTHYLMHMVPILWRVHRVHHLDTELDVSTTVRVHPLEFVIGLFPGLTLVVLFGLSPWVLMTYEVLDAGVNVWTHSNVRVPRVLTRALKYIIVTPDLHRVHHSAWKPETNSNFGAVFPIWDLIFRTFRDAPRDGHERMQLGLDTRGPEIQRPLWLLASPMRTRHHEALDDAARRRGVPTRSF